MGFRMGFAALLVMPLAAVTEPRACLDAPGALVVEYGSGTEVGGHLNWFLAGADRQRGAAAGLLEPLFVAGADGVLEPWLADKLEWIEEGRLFRLHLRREAAWSDGMPFSAQDVAFTLETAMARPELDGLHMAAVRAAVESVEVEDRRHLVIALREGQGAFVRQVLTAGASDALVIAPAHLWQTRDPARSGDGIAVGTGSYLLSDWRPDRVMWQRDDHWWGAESHWRDLPGPEWLVWNGPGHHVAAVENELGDTRPGLAEIRARALTRSCADVVADPSCGMVKGLASVAPRLTDPPGDRAVCPDGPVTVSSRGRWGDLPMLLAGRDATLSNQSAIPVLLELQNGGQNH